MTEKRAIQILKMNEQEKWRSGITAEEEKEAFDMAIEALKERPHGEWIDKRIVMEKLQEATANASRPEIARGLLEAQRILTNMKGGADMREEGGDS